MASPDLPQTLPGDDLSDTNHADRFPHCESTPAGSRSHDGKGANLALERPSSAARPPQASPSLQTGPSTPALPARGQRYWSEDE
eukprot:360137-Chlamydomonas_euryale.AAC.5